MHRLILAGGVGLLAAMTGMPSYAADLPRPSYKAPAYSAPSAFSWSGFYVGANAGYGWGKSRWTDATGFATGEFNLSGLVAGGTLGYNLQAGSLVYGLEGDLDYSTIKGSAGTLCGGGPGACETRNTWLGTARARLGYSFDRWLPYITGGAAFGGIKMTPVSGGASDSQTKLGWTLGLGLEYAFLGSWSAKVEYLYADLGTARCSTACGGPTDVTFKTNLLRVGLNYRF